MNPGLEKLHPYPFEKLARLIGEISPPVDKSPINLSIGEPKHTTPEFILDEIKKNLHKTSMYPTTRGSDELRQSITSWIIRRFNLPESSLDPDKNILPVNGTREAIFAFAQCVVDNREEKPAIVLPNPFYQIYEGASLLAGAEPVYVNCRKSNNYLPDFESIPGETWKRCQLLYLCSPGNPTGTVIDQKTIESLLDLADKYNFVIAADECYSEIYFDEAQPPLGLLQAAANTGRDNYHRCIVFHSLSKRSNVPGLRSGFVAGDQTLIQAFLKYRTYHGCAMPLHTQAASMLAWQDESHVISNRELYSEKFDAVLDILQPVMDVQRPMAGFYLWPELSIADTDFARGLYQAQHVTVLPGSFLSRPVNDINPGANHLRIALVAPVAECIDAAERMCQYIKTL